MKRLVIFLSMIVIISSLVTVIIPIKSYAADASCNAYVFAIPAWYNGMMTKNGDNCEFEGIKADSNKLDIRRTLLKIILNVIRALLVVSAYVFVFFLVKGGFPYIYSTGSPEGVSGAKKTIQNSMIGLLIVVFSNGIVATIGELI